MKPKLLMLLFGLLAGADVSAQDPGAWRSAVADEARRILDYWTTHAVDTATGGFFGRVGLDNTPDPEAARSAVLNTRILWTYAAAGRVLDEAGYRPLADRAFHYLLEHFVDPVYGGVYWSVAPDGRAADPSKQVYAQSFAIYALAEYYHWTGVERAREEAVRIYRLLQAHALDTQYGGYLEAFGRDWSDSDDRYLAGGQEGVWKTMNTHLHVLEAFSKLYVVWPDPELGERLEDLLGIFSRHIFDPGNGHLDLFFGRDWTVRGESISFGHDIEASWLLLEAAERLGSDWPEQVRPMAIELAARTLAEGLDSDGGLLYEAEPHGLSRTEKSWWPQAEAMVGFYNAYQMTGTEAYREASFQVWSFIDGYLADRKGGEWLGMLDRERQPLGNNDKVNPWKAPYHNTRSCLEMYRRLSGSH